MALPQNTNVEKSFNEKRKSQFHDDNNFHSTIAPGAAENVTAVVHWVYITHLISVVALAQFFGLFPIKGIFKKSFRNLEFKWISVRAFHSTLWLLSAFTLTYLEILRVSRDEKLNPKSISWVWFFILIFLVKLFIHRWNNFLSLRSVRSNFSFSTCNEMVGGVRSFW